MNEVILRDYPPASEAELREAYGDEVVAYCANCGAPLTANRRGRRRKFCSDKCRSQYDHAHPNVDTWVGVRQVTCEYCGKVFTAFRETNSPRRFCSKSCAARARWRIKR